VKELKTTVIQYIISIILLLISWKGLVVFFNLPAYILPAPDSVIITLTEETGLFMKAFQYTISNTILGGLSGIVLGVVVGIILAYSERIRWIVEPYLMIFQSFPRESLFPLFLIWLGFGDAPKIFNSFLLSFFPVAVIVLNALINVDDNYIKLMKSWYSSKQVEFFHCRLPYSVPQIISAIKVGLPLALIGAVLGEFMGGNKGLGYIIISSGAQFRVDRIFASITILALIGIGFLALTQLMQKLFLKKYYF
jgi:NitT/TauT family transport system permease protein